MQLMFQNSARKKTGIQGEAPGNALVIKHAGLNANCSGLPLLDFVALADVGRLAAALKDPSLGRR